MKELQGTRCKPRFWRIPPDVETWSCVNSEIQQNKAMLRWPVIRHTPEASPINLSRLTTVVPITQVIGNPTRHGAPQRISGSTLCGRCPGC